MNLKCITRENVTIRRFWSSAVAQTAFCHKTFRARSRSERFQVSLPAAAADCITPFVLAGLKAAWAALKTCASEGKPPAWLPQGLRPPRQPPFRLGRMHFLQSCQLHSLRRFVSGSNHLILVNFLTTVACLRVAYWLWPYKFIPWKLRLSERAQEELTAFRPRKTPKLEDLVYDEVPSRDIPDGGISQMLLYSLLDLVAIAFTMLEAAHPCVFSSLQ